MKITMEIPMENPTPPLPVIVEPSNTSKLTPFTMKSYTHKEHHNAQGDQPERDEFHVFTVVKPYFDWKILERHSEFNCKFIPGILQRPRLGGSLNEDWANDSTVRGVHYAISDCIIYRPPINIGNAADTIVPIVDKPKVAYIVDIYGGDPNDLYIGALHCRLPLGIAEYPISPSQERAYDHEVTLFAKNPRRSAAQTEEHAIKIQRTCKPLILDARWITDRLEQSVRRSWPFPNMTPQIGWLYEGNLDPVDASIAGGSSEASTSVGSPSEMSLSEG